MFTISANARHARRWSALALTAALAACAASPAIAPGQGVNVGEASQLRKIVPAEELEQSAAAQYATLVQQASAKGQVAAPGDPQLTRLQKISQRIIPQASRFNPRATNPSARVAGHCVRIARPVASSATGRKTQDPEPVMRAAPNSPSQFSALSTSG